MLFDLIREYQLNIMLALCITCIVMAILLLITRFLPRKKKWILVMMEIASTFLLAFDRAAYIYKGDTSDLGYVMVRLSNFMVFFMTSAIVLAFNLYITNLLLTDGLLDKMPKRLIVSQIGAMAGMALAVISHFTGLYYYFDEQNIYHRGAGFLIAYLIPVIIPILQYTVILQYRKKFSKLIYFSLTLYIFVPIVFGIIQIFTYGISLVNMSMALVSAALYIFAYLDINEEAIKAHKIEVANLEKEQQSIRRLFDQTATAFVTAVEKRDEFQIGHSVNVANLAKKIAESAGKSKEECDEVYYTGLLHDVGMIGIPDAIMKKTEGLTEEERNIIHQRPVFSAEILSNISEYPYLENGAMHVYERYNGSGYPDGLKGDDIPEISRIIAVADAYDTMTRKQRFREPLTFQDAREEFVKQSGLQFDPHYSDIMIHIMDEGQREEDKKKALLIQSEIDCGKYRESVTNGIPVTEEEILIYFVCENTAENEKDFSAPSIILFDSYDRHVHEDKKTIKAYSYLEYGEAWFDGNFVSTSARNMEVHVRDEAPDSEIKEKEYLITAKRYEDHVSIVMRSAAQTVDIIVALPYNSKASYIGLTGENCRIKDISVQKTGAKTTEGEIKQIVSKISYTNRLEADVANVQIDRHRSASSNGIPIRDESVIEFHSMSLPSATLVWHCPYVVLFSSDDAKVNGENYKEYAVIKLNGEIESDDAVARNQFYMKKTEEFKGWDAWKEENKKGLEYSISLRKRGNKVTFNAENFGVEIRNITTLPQDGKVYASLTGDEVAITDIRVR